MKINLLDLNSWWNTVLYRIYYNQYNFLNSKNGGLEIFKKENQMAEKLFPVKGSRNIWVSKDGREYEISKMPIPYLKNVYLFIWNEAWEIVITQETINRYTKLNYPGRYELSRIKRTSDFLMEFCFPFYALYIEARRNNICKQDGTPLLEEWKLSNGSEIKFSDSYKRVTDEGGKQYILIEMDDV